MDIWQNWLPELDKRMTLVASFYNAEGEGFRVELESLSFLEAVKK